MIKMELNKILGSKYTTKKEEKNGTEAATDIPKEAAGSDSGGVKAGKGKPGPKLSDKS
jgi:hypothetical protein